MNRTIPTPSGLAAARRARKKRAPGFVPLFALLFLLLLAAGCSTAPYTGRSQFIMMDSSTEMQLGAQASQEVLQTENVETGTERARRVERIGKRIAAVAERPNFKWEFHTIRKNELNAFCLPGGRVFVYTGLIEMIGSSDDELAAVMGHEIAHAIARHGAERSSQTSLASLGLNVASAAASIYTNSPDVGDAVMSGGGALAQLGILLPYSRKHETEADHIGVILAAKAGYDPRAAIPLWEKMGRASQGKEPPALLSTHPLNAQRIKDLQGFIPEALKYYKK
ncbi:M48 family metallopeptidase [Desulfovibrio sp. OttesenSCG-928-C14]|nr:M48 family metallopeptidase [Desulfovibrio sp. OttesenSCG-928-C14]